MKVALPKRCGCSGLNELAGDAERRKRQMRTRGRPTVLHSDMVVRFKPERERKLGA